MWDAEILPVDTGLGDVDAADGALFFGAEEHFCLLRIWVRVKQSRGMKLLLLETVWGDEKVNTVVDRKGWESCLMVGK